MATAELVALPDGRVLEAVVEGPAGGLTLLLCLGTPNGASPSPAIAAVAAEHGLRLVSFNRPGYGASTRLPGRSVADVAADVEALLGHLDADGFVVVGTSGGGPHALACAALLPGRCRAAATVAGVAPWEAEGLDFLAGMGPENHEEFGLALDGEAALRPYCAAAADGLGAITAAEVAEALGGLVSPVDAAALSGDFAEWMAGKLRAAVATGPDGWIDDDLAFVRPWGFALDAITAPVCVWQGDADLMVPLAHGEWLAAHVAGAQARLLPGEGHVSLLTAQLPRILRELAAAAR